MLAASLKVHGNVINFMEIIAYFGKFISNIIANLHAFRYPDGTSIRGKVEHGTFIEANYYDENEELIKECKIDILRREQMPRYLMDPDPYESNVSLK